jgi:voltage-gated potassium channel
MKKRIYEILEVANSGDSISRVIDISIAVLILLNVCAVIIETIPSLKNYAGYFYIFEAFSVAIFTIEYILRVWSCTEDKGYAKPINGRLRYILSPLAVIDLLAILPFYLPMFFVLDLRILRMFRLVRIFRILKFGRYSTSLQMMGNVLIKKKEELGIVLFIVILLLVLASSVLFYVENEAQPNAFSSIPASMWWGIATLTTVGYGDMYPVTPLGKILGAVIALFGIGLFALPAGILASGFADELDKKGRNKKECPHCGKDLED